MPQVRIEIDGQIKTGPSENVPTLLKFYPNAKVLGLVTTPISQIPGEIGRKAFQRFRETQNI